MNYFTETAASILGNNKLRTPQIEAYMKAQEHFANSDEDALIVLPTGTGKSGLISIVPFGLAQGRVLIITPSFDHLWITYSTVTDFARFRGWSTSVPFNTAT